MSKLVKVCNNISSIDGILVEVGMVFLVYSYSDYSGYYDRHIVLNVSLDYNCDGIECYNMTPDKLVFIDKFGNFYSVRTLTECLDLRH